VNRAERRRLPKAAQAADNLHTVRCPDCDNDTQLIAYGSAYIVQILHDDTCPTYRRLLAEGRAS
jgi:hypothetical protein